MVLCGAATVGLAEQTSSVELKIVANQREVTWARMHREQTTSCTLAARISAVDGPSLGLGSLLKAKVCCFS
jgi:hypothetical protein